MTVVAAAVVDVTESLAVEIVVAETLEVEIAEAETLANVVAATTVVETVAVATMVEIANTTMTEATGNTIMNVAGIEEVVAATVVRGVAAEIDEITTTIAVTTSGAATISGVPTRITKEDDEIRSSLPTTFPTLRPPPPPLLHSLFISQFADPLNFLFSNVDSFESEKNWLRKFCQEKKAENFFIYSELFVFSKIV